ncbi:MAG: ParB/RepB/Spo0J family partition protein [Acetobacteraceae bacterium]|nr:ParB/RepB/Spo0J family partition protein [Acetobacteraceae bacterium]
MTATKSRFTSLAQAVKERTAEAEGDTHASEASRPAGAGVHKPAAALTAAGETLRDHIARLEAQLARETSKSSELYLQLERAKALKEKAGDAAEEFIYLHADAVVDHLPRDRLRGRSEGREFDELLADIETNGQNDAITVRRGSDGTYEVAAGRRRLEVCKRLQRPVLARVRELDDQAMLRIQFSENERRTDISALERARWFSEVRDRLKSSSKEVAAQFGVDPSTFSLYLRLARFPDEILNRLDEPNRLAVLPARRIMEVIEKDSTTVSRILDALDDYRQSAANSGWPEDPGVQIDVLIRAAEGRGANRAGPRSPVPDRRHVVYQGRRIGTLTRNGGQWVFRFATSIPDSEVQALVERLAIPLGEAEGQFKPLASSAATARRR